MDISNFTTETWLNISHNRKCNTTMPFFDTVLGLCVTDTKSLLSVITGILSIICWMIYGFPQIILNFKKGIPDEAISPWLLLFWLFGDCANMVGAILTNQLRLQIAMAAYAILCDIVLDGQYIYAVVKRKLRGSVGPQKFLYESSTNYIDSVSVKGSKNGLRRPNRSRDIDSSNDGSVNNNNRINPGNASIYCVGLFCLTLFSFSSPNQENTHRSRILLSNEELYHDEVPLFTNDAQIFGYVLGCLSSVFYCSGRLPQILKNFKRKCTEGLSVGLFIFAMFGNLFYGAQIFLISVDKIFMLQHLPWIIGSWGVMFLDGFILIQFFLYRKNIFQQYEILTSVDDDDDIPIINNDDHSINSRETSVNNSYNNEANNNNNHMLIP